jgi:hypothetical protein
MPDASSLSSGVPEVRPLIWFGYSAAAPDRGAVAPTTGCRKSDSRVEGVFEHTPGADAIGVKIGSHPQERVKAGGVRSVSTRSNRKVF